MKKSTNNTTLESKQQTKTNSYVDTKQEYSKSNRILRKITLTAMFVALSVVMSLYNFLIAGDTIRIGFSSVPITIIGFLFGPLFGMIGGALADTLAYILNPKGVFHIGFTLNSMIGGLIAGYVGHLYRKNKVKHTVVLFVTTLCAFFIFFGYYIFKMPESFKLPTINSIAYVFLCAGAVLIIGGLLYTVFHKQKLKYSILMQCVTHSLLTFLISTVLLTPIWLKQLGFFDSSFFPAYRLTRFFISFLTLPISIAILYTLYLVVLSVPAVQRLYRSSK